MSSKAAIPTMSAAAAAAVAALSVYTSKIQFFHQQDVALGFQSEDNTRATKFEPRFDGLRFIETLVTAHR
ncbi:unnamed protein product [Rhodiola kirilowii]